MALVLIIAGGSHYRRRAGDFEWLDSIHAAHQVIEVVSGQCIWGGADELGEDWAGMRRIPVKGFPAKWSASPQGAGHARNREMAEYARSSGHGACALFPGRNGTEGMLLAATRCELRIFTRVYPCLR